MKSEISVPRSRVKTMNNDERKSLEKIFAEKPPRPTSAVCRCHVVCHALGFVTTTTTATATATTRRRNEGAAFTFANLVEKHTDRIKSRNVVERARNERVEPLEHVAARKRRCTAPHRRAASLFGGNRVLRCGIELTAAISCTTASWNSIRILRSLWHVGGRREGNNKYSDQWEFVVRRSFAKTVFQLSRILVINSSPSSC